MLFQHVIYIKNQNEVSNIFPKSETQGAFHTPGTPQVGLATFQALDGRVCLVAILLFAQI